MTGSRARSAGRVERVGAAITTLALALSGCGGRMPNDLGVVDGRLRGCPPSPNCVSSTATEAPHAIAPLAIEGDVGAAWAAARATVAASPRTEVVADEPAYLHAIETSALMRYRDDLELHLDPARRRIEVRSASRVGYGDMGVNRARVERLRAILADRGVVEGSATD